MELTTSVSKGVFLISNGYKKSSNTKKKNLTLFESCFKKEYWYVAYKNNWQIIEDKIQDVHNRAYGSLLDDVVEYVKTIYKESQETDSVIPSATLLTGVNQPDHISQFKTLIDKIQNEVTPHIAIVNSQDAPTVKHLIENTVWQIIHGQNVLDTSLDKSFDTKPIKKLRKNQCTMKALTNWYATRNATLSPKKKKQKPTKQSIVVIIPDFESFNCNVLQDMVMILSSYLPKLPIILIFGVATSVSALHKSFPYHVSSKLLIKVFQSHSSPVYMNQVLEEIFLTHSSPFHLSAKSFELLTDVFLFYDFSTTGLIQSIRYCMMDHYFGDNTKSLCTEKENLEVAISKLSSEDLESMRQLMSFRPFLEAQQDAQTKISLFEDDEFFREVLQKEIKGLHDYMYTFYTCIRLLSSFVKELPKSLLGKSVREIYSKCAGQCITSLEAFKECMQLIGFQSQLKLVETIKSSLKVLNGSLQILSPIKPLRSTPTKHNMNNSISVNSELGDGFLKTVRIHLLMFLRQLENANTEATQISNSAMVVDDDLENTPGNRYKLKEKLLKATKIEKVQSEFEMVRSRFVSYLEDMFTKGLQPPHTQPFHEIFFFSEIYNVKKHIIGAPRGAVHTALSNPVHYLQCSCCHLPSPESTTASLLDTCLLYKLHRECGKHINLYDWLQAFAAILNPAEEEDGRHDPEIQKRFTRAVAELQFLGFIKASKRKTDHVMRLTW